MTNSKSPRPKHRDSFHNNAPKAAGIKKEWSPAARKAAETRASTKHHAAVCHTRAGGGSLGGCE